MGEDGDAGGEFDERMTDDSRITLHRPRELADAVLALYPEDEYPDIQNEQDAWVRLAHDCLDHECPVVIRDSVVVIDGEVDGDTISEAVREFRRESEP